MKKYISVETPIGTMRICEEEGYLTHLLFVDDVLSEGVVPQETELLKEAKQQLEEYLAGERRIFSLPLRPAGTEFYQDVWNALCEIPYGEVATYKDIAIMVGRERAMRAVGLANNRNPLPIVVPCHRVIGTNGALVGYGGGLSVKEFLLQLEGIL